MVESEHGIIEFRANEPESIVTFRPDGSIEVNPKYDTDEAARAIWDAVRKLARPSSDESELKPVAWRWRRCDWPPSYWNYSSAKPPLEPVHKQWTVEPLYALAAPDPEIEGLKATLTEEFRVSASRAAEIERLADRVRELEAERDELDRKLKWQRDCSDRQATTIAGNIIDTFAAESTISSLSGEVERLRAILEPFAKMADDIDAWQTGTDPDFPKEFRADWFRAARAALSAQKGDHPDAE